MWLDPVAFTIFGFAVHWYGLLWVAGAMQFLIVANRYGRLLLGKAYQRKVAEEVMFSCMLGSFVGGRLGYVLFYGLDQALADPLWVFRLWEGGMSFHGGLVGVVLGVLWTARALGLDPLRLGDLVALGAPGALALVRFGNFINGELWGKPTDLPWGIVFERVDDMPRHPSQLYELIGEGALMFFVLLWVAKKTARPGLVATVFMTGYAIVRFAIEFVREPDAHIGYLAWGLTTGQWLSLPMFIAGLCLVAYVWSRSSKPGARQRG